MTKLSNRVNKKYRILAIIIVILVVNNIGIALYKISRNEVREVSYVEHKEQLKIFV